jgi:hypothetical protein
MYMSAWGISIRRTVVVVAVVVRVGVLGGADVVHLVGGSALHAARLGLVAGELGELAIGHMVETGCRTVIHRTPCESTG